MSETAVNLSVSADILRPIVLAVVRDVLAEVERDRAVLGERLAYSEQEAAHLLGLERHVLRDERRRGRITASRIVGRRIKYLRADLEQYLRDRRGE